jgi:hypothetical protein
MSVYNGERYLREAVDSVLNQSYAAFEFIVIDDGSTDGSLEILNSYRDPRIRILRNERNLGLIGSLNKGLAAAEGEYLARQDCDDLLAPDRLARQVAYLDEHTDVVLVGTWMQLIDERGADITLWRYPGTDAEIRWATLFNTAVGHPSAMFRTEVAKRIGGYSSECLYAEDYDLWSRLATHGKTANLPEPLQRYRVHGNTVSTKNSAKQLQTRLAISKRNIEEFTHELSPLVMQLIAQAAAPTTKNELLDTISGYQLLLTRFRARVPLAPDVEERIVQSVVESLSSAFQHVGWHERLSCLLKKSAFFPAKFWLRGRFLSFVLSDGLKRSIATLLGKKSGEVLRSS